jgi:hypothetical protein
VTAAPGGGQRPLCFVLMPFGTKTDASGSTVNFDSVYRHAIAPAADDAAMDVVRADEEREGGIIHKPMFERLVLCAYAVADLTLANANVFYELGVRHAVRPHTTVLLFAKGGQRLPFDVAPLRAIPYQVDDNGAITDPDGLRRAIADRLRAARDPSADSPLYQLLEGFDPPDIARLKTDVFRDRVRYNDQVKARLSAARRHDDAATEVAQVHESLRPLADQEAGVVVDLMLSYRDAGDTAAMVALVEDMPAPIAASVLIREQLAFALNREGRGDDAERVLQNILVEHGPSSETLGLLGRVYKDRWLLALTENDAAAPGLLAKAIDAYRRGFDADWRDAYPGVNAVTLLELQSPGQPLVAELVPVVRYSASRRLASEAADYWDHATMLELAVVARDEEDARARLSAALAERPDDWMRETTARQLESLADARASAGEDTAVVREFADRLRLAPPT